MLISELIKLLEEKKQIVGDNYVYIIAPADEHGVCGFDVDSVGLDADDSIVIDVRYYS